MYRKTPFVEQLIKNNYELFKHRCDGVGSKNLGWFYHFIPNSILGLDITICSDLHDNEFGYNDKTKIQFHRANKYFYANLETLIIYKTKPGLLQDARLFIASMYFKAVEKYGWTAFKGDY
jgi:hypothetical protein